MDLKSPYVKQQIIATLISNGNLSLQPFLLYWIKYFKPHLCSITILKTT